MKLLNNLQTLLIDLRDKIQRRQYHVECALCHWEVRNLEHRRFAVRRGQMHLNNSHQYAQLVAALNNTRPPKYGVWFTRA